VTKLPACQMIFDVIGDLFTHGRQLEQFVFDNRIVGLLGKFPILGRFPVDSRANPCCTVPMGWGRDDERTAKSESRGILIPI
jgi:hypothetical protein